MENWTINRASKVNLANHANQSESKWIKWIRMNQNESEWINVNQKIYFLFQSGRIMQVLLIFQEIPVNSLMESIFRFKNCQNTLKKMKLTCNKNLLKISLNWILVLIWSEFTSLLVFFWLVWFLLFTKFHLSLKVFVLQMFGS